MHTTKLYRPLVVLTLVALFRSLGLAATPMGTVFTYQGRLTVGTNLANGPYDLQFTLYDDGGTAVSGPITNSPVGVTDGLFTAVLDFGADVFAGQALWLEIGVRAHGAASDFTILTPRQPVLPAPYALYASSAAGLRSFSNVPLDLTVNGQRGFRLEPATNWLFETDYIFGGPNVIGGSSNNWVSAGLSGATIGGGGGEFIHWGCSLFSCGNEVTGDFGTVGGGVSNTSDFAATVGGGQMNTSRGYYATVGGGAHNTSSNWCATVPGGSENIAGGRNSLAAGFCAHALHDGAFVWGDSTYADVASTNADSWTVRASGGIRFFANSGATVGAYLPPGGNGFSPMSDRHVKENFRPVDARSVLEKVSRLPVTEWNLVSQPANIRHIGPVAQDFKAAFGVGEDDLHISTSDADGVALAAIQGLHELVKDKDARIAELERSVAELKALVKTLAEKVNGGGQ